MNNGNVMAFSVVLCEANETLEFSLGGGSSSITFFSVEVKYRAEISLPQNLQNRLN